MLLRHPLALASLSALHQTEPIDSARPATSVSLQHSRLSQSLITSASPIEAASMSPSLRTESPNRNSNGSDPSASATQPNGGPGDQGNRSGRILFREAYDGVNNAKNLSHRRRDPNTRYLGPFPGYPPSGSGPRSTYGS